MLGEKEGRREGVRGGSEARGELREKKEKRGREVEEGVHTVEAEILNTIHSSLSMIYLL